MRGSQKKQFFANTVEDKLVRWGYGLDIEALESQSESPHL